MVLLLCMLSKIKHYAVGYLHNSFQKEHILKYELVMASYNPLVVIKAYAEVNQARFKEYIN